MANSTDTITAVASPPGRGGISVIRVSGPLTGSIMHEVCGQELKPRSAKLCNFSDRNGTTIDRGIAIYFPKPNSFTGEDVIEFQGHGGPVVNNLLMTRLRMLGARLAKPGEFSLRAFLNGRIDLSQAEAIADLIDSRTESAARAAQRSIAGEFSVAIEDLRNRITKARVWVEAAIDFPEEDIDFLNTGSLSLTLVTLEEAIQNVLKKATQGVLLKAGISMAIVGQPNVGKSSLLNAMTGIESAIVTEIPGTTRDLVHATVEIAGVPVSLIDTAGVHETADPIEIIGIERTYGALNNAYIVCLVVDDRWGVTVVDQELLERVSKSAQLLVVHNKADLSGGVVGVKTGTQRVEVSISAKTGDGLDVLSSQITEMLTGIDRTEDVFVARERHVESLQNCLKNVNTAIIALNELRAGELVAEDLRQAHRDLGEIVGEFTNDDLLGEIFAGFCIGK